MRYADVTRPVGSHGDRRGTQPDAHSEQVG